MREIRLFELDGGQTVFWQNETPQSLQVLQGLLWLTVEGESVDHWLRAGESFEMRAGQRIWLGTWKDGARLRVSQPTMSLSALPGRPTARRFGWRVLWRDAAARVTGRMLSRS
ncbi:MULTISPECIES: DUF2917 domain-containing protein [Pandoraea]|uniref:DUF2917 domain-containing protein n=1 Tax=Pandoraea norimbergensis TaxID=93219 RepID=A0ABM5WPP7_9BURK|nr:MULTISPECIES: DUF2917 domain-containing protein [Pandoraea]ALS62581.1 hypothetical protein AT302_25075 [Pandoraea norimbergensis]